jgi:hypothetical protein
MDDAETVARRLRIVCDNLAARVGQLIAENLELMVRLHEYEQSDTGNEVE